MGTTAARFLQDLDPGRRPDLPATTAGTLRLDMRGEGCTDHWYLTVADQHVRVTRSADDADLLVRADRAVFDQLATGQLHLAEALLRNELTVRGDMALLMLLRRIFPGPAGARHPRALGRAALAEHEGSR
ncbi:SCP2 sterol-binding domain-containing protein [Micromonospora lupini]|uniref:SCP2 sterol-binding domain-containing protein n=1 Tax=Micromonospora lupini TaxID=285679 RepID=UPI00340C381A